MPFALASSANCRFHVSKPAAVLPQGAPSALVLTQASTAKAVKVAVVSCLLPLVTENSLALRTAENTAKRPVGIASSPVYHAPDIPRRNN
jgi:hypothetical protein